MLDSYFILVYNRYEKGESMQKDLNYSELFSEYKMLLTENQAEIFELYYICDLSLSEISEMKNIWNQLETD